MLLKLALGVKKRHFINGGIHMEIGYFQCKYYIYFFFLSLGVWVCSNFNNIPLPLPLSFVLNHQNLNSGIFFHACICISKCRVLIPSQADMK